MTTTPPFSQAGGGGAPPAPGVEIPNGAFVAKITNDAREEEMEENMEQVRYNKAEAGKPLFGLQQTEDSGKPEKAIKGFFRQRPRTLFRRLLKGDKLCSMDTKRAN